MEQQEMWELCSSVEPNQRRYLPHPHHQDGTTHPGVNDLHAWGIYRQNLNSDFTDSALGSEERGPPTYGHFELKDTTVQSILSHPRLAPRTELANNMYAYLKFGLPRVFPPQPKGGASSDIQPTDSASTRAHPPPPARANSETDLHFNNNSSGLVSNRFRRPQAQNNQHHLVKSTSESNLLHNGRTALSKAGSQASLVSRPNLTPHSHHNGGFYMDGGEGAEEESARGGLFLYPHLQVRNLGYESGAKRRVLEGISFDLHGGECLALLATNGDEVTTLLDILSGRVGRGKVWGEFTLNGHPLSIQALGSRTAYVRKDYRLDGLMTVEQTLFFHHRLRSSDPSNSSYLKEKIGRTVEELGLGAVAKGLVSSLTSSERQRLAVGCQVITGAEILLLDDPTGGMDIFDTFFLVDYLRGWSVGGSGRLVIISIHPPTYEIFSMFTKVALLSTGRLMFYGHRREMLPYFAFIEYPCPAFKNPSDYYLDLVTLDNLSSEALLESSQRIEALADSYRRKAEVLGEGAHPPHPLPPRIRGAGFLGQFCTLVCCWVVYRFPWNLLSWLLTLLLSTGASITVGALFWNLRLLEGQDRDQNNVWDRLGFHWVLMVLLLLPFIALLAAASGSGKEEDALARDFQERIYSKAVYFMAKNIVEVPYLWSIYLSYTIPAYVMGGLAGNDPTQFYAFVGYMVLYLHTFHLLFQALHQVLGSRSAALTLLLPVLVVLSSVSSYPLHPSHLGEWVSWLKFFSPTSLLYPRLIGDEFTLSKEADHFACPHNPVRPNNQIVTALECPLDSGRRVLEHYEMGPQGPLLIPLLTVAAVAFVSYWTAFFAFILRRQGVAKPPIETP